MGIDIGYGNMMNCISSWLRNTGTPGPPAPITSTMPLLWHEILLSRL